VGAQYDRGRDDTVAAFFSSGVPVTAMPSSPSPRVGAGARALIAALPGDAVPMGDDRGLWTAFDGSVRAELSGAEWAAMQACDEFRSRDAHVAAVRVALHGAPFDVAALVDSLLARGLLLPPESFIPAEVPDDASLPLPEPLVAIRAFDLPDELQRLLRSLLAHEQRYGAGRRYLIIDDTLDAASAARCAALVRDFAAATTSAVYRIGAAHQETLLAALGGELDRAARDVLATLIDPRTKTTITGSRAYNIAMLAAAGTAVSLLDHDTMLPWRLPPDAQHTFDLHDSTVNDTGYLDDVPFDTLPPYDGDGFALMRTQVGAAVANVLARDGWQRETLAGRSARELAHLRRAPRIIGAFGGIYGGVAFNSSSVLMTGTPASLQRLWRSPYRHDRLEGDRVWHGTTSPRLTSYAVYSPVLLDARALLPFAGTWGHADDTQFLAMLTAMDPRTAFVFSPLLVGHFPPGSRDRRRRGLEPLLLDRNGLLAADVDDLGQRLCGSDRAGRLAAIGAFAADIAHSTDASLTQHVHRWREGRLADFVERLSRIVATNPGAPREWQDYAARALAVNREAMRESAIAPQELAKFRSAYAQLAAGATLWPRVWARALTLPLLDGLIRPVER
jgi:hypothetical protein